MMDSSNSKEVKRKSLTLEEKIEIINRLENGSKNWELCNDYEVNSSTISTILKMKDKLKVHYDELNDINANVKRKRIQKLDFEALDTTVYAWLCQRRIIAEPVSGLILKEKARTFFSILKESGQIPENHQDFKASDGWLSKFKDRHGLRTLQPKGEKGSADTVASDTFIKSFNEFLNKNHIDHDNVYNADETGLQFKSLPEKTLVLANEQEVAGHKPLKERLTIMVCANATGSHRIPLLVIGKSARPRCFKKGQTLPLDYTNQKKALMNADIFLYWFKEIFLKKVRQLKPNAKIILLLDNAPTHPSAEKLNAIDERCSAIYLPPNVTSLIQPMDQGVISALKRHYKMGFLRESLAHNHNNTSSFVQFVKKWTVLDCMNVLRESWMSLTPSTLRNSWKKLIKTLQSNVEVTTSNHVLVNLINRVPGGSLCSTNDIESWLEKEKEVILPTFQPISDEELLNTHAGLQLAVPKEDVTEESCDIIENFQEAVPNVPTQDFILNSAQCIVEWARERSDLTDEEHLILIKVRDLTLNSLLKQN